MNPIQSNTSLILKRCRLQKILRRILSVLNQKESWELTNLNLKIKRAELESFASRMEGEVTLKYRLLELIHCLQQFSRFGRSDSSEIKERITRLLNDTGNPQIVWKAPKEKAFSALSQFRFQSLESLRMRSASLASNRKEPKETSKGD